MNQLHLLDQANTQKPCDQCHIGRMEAEKITYFTRQGANLITVPDFPAWKCDICGYLEYDLNALNNLVLLLQPQKTQPSHISTDHTTSHLKQSPLARRSATSK